MISSLLQGNVLLALAAALLWGGGDFSGGMGVKTVGGSVGGAFRIVLLSHLTSFTILVAIGSLRAAPFPHGAILAWGIGAGVMGGLSITGFYIALSRGAMGASAAVSGLLAAAIPAAVALITDGSPGLLRLAGFLVAGAAIWLIAAGPTLTDAPSIGVGSLARSTARSAAKGTMGLAVAAGAGFGIYFVALKMASPAGPLWTMATARIGSIGICSLMLLGVSLSDRTTSIRVTWIAVQWVLLTALMDTSGNMLFVAATRAGRLDVASVLASLYPATTILLAAWTLKERPTGRQVTGMLIAAIAVVMITI